MSIGINDFTAQFAGGARPSLFRALQFFPAGIGIEASRKFQYQCKGAQLPGKNISPIDVMYMGRQIKVAGDQVFEDITFTILNDTDFVIRRAYEAWMSMINGNESNLGVTNPNMYYADIDIEQLDRDESVLQRYTLVGAFPTNISPIDLDWGATDTVEEYTVTLSYQYWLPGRE